MDAPTLIAGALVVAGALALVLYPLWQQARPHPVFTDPIQQQLADAQARYEASLTAIKALMFDYELGKVAEADYEPLLTKAKLEAAQTRRNIDRLSQTMPLDPPLEASIEQQIVALKQTLPEADQTMLAEIDAEIALLKEATSQETATAYSCPQCGYACQPGDAFCAGCGVGLQPDPSRQTLSNPTL